MKKTIIRTGLETLYFSGMHHWMRPLVGGVGAILTLHHVRPPRVRATTLDAIRISHRVRPNAALRRDDRSSNGAPFARLYDRADDDADNAANHSTQ